MQVLLWLHLAYRPLNITELQHALSVEPDDTEFSEDNIPHHEILLKCCLGLVIIDRETETVRLVHYTLEEFFKDSDNANIYFPNRYTTVSRICLTYLTFENILLACNTDEDLEARKTEFAFLEYAACHWGKYMQLQANVYIEQLAFKLTVPCRYYANHIYRAGGSRVIRRLPEVSQVLMQQQYLRYIIT